MKLQYKTVEHFMLSTDIGVIIADLQPHSY